MDRNVSVENRIIEKLKLMNTNYDDLKPFVQEWLKKNRNRDSKERRTVD